MTKEIKVTNKGKMVERSVSQPDKKIVERLQNNTLKCMNASNISVYTEVLSTKKETWSILEWTLMKSVSIQGIGLIRLRIGITGGSL